MNKRNSWAILYLYRYVVLDNQPLSSQPWMDAASVWKVQLTRFEFSTFDCSFHGECILSTLYRSSWVGVLLLLLFFILKLQFFSILLAAHRWKGKTSKRRSFWNSQHNNKVYSLKIIVISSHHIVSTSFPDLYARVPGQFRWIFDQKPLPVAIKSSYAKKYSVYESKLIDKHFEINCHWSSRYWIAVKSNKTA